MLRNVLYLPYKEEVAGSSPAAPTIENPRPAGKTFLQDDAPAAHWGPTTSPVHHRGLSERFLYRIGGLPTHAGRLVGVGVEGDGDGGVP